MATVTFDPLSEDFMAPSKRPNTAEPMNLRTLSAYQRALLVMDGTVTKFIEAVAMEPIDTIRLSQETTQLSAYHEWLDAPEGTDVWVRQVLLCGKYSHTLYAYAASLLVPDRIPKAEKEKLNVDGESIGKILLAGQMESRREVIWYGKEDEARVPNVVRNLGYTKFLSRTYRIIATSKPIMIINEKFPYEINPMPSHH